MPTVPIDASLKIYFFSYLELFKKISTIEECISCCGKVLEKLKRKHQIAGKDYNKVLDSFENLDKSGEEVKSAQFLEDYQASSTS